MNHPTSEPQADLQLDPAAVLGLAGQAQTAADQVSGDRAFRRLHLSGDMLGGFSGAAAVAAAHGSAHSVVNETIEGVRKDLEAFSGYLKQAVAGIEDADHLSSGALARLADIRVGNEADRANREARDKYVPPDQQTTPTDG